MYVCLSIGQNGVGKCIKMYDSLRLCVKFCDKEKHLKNDSVKSKFAVKTTRTNHIYVFKNLVTIVYCLYAAHFILVAYLV